MSVDVLAVGAHMSHEVSSLAYHHYYRALARTRGCEIGSEYAVTFAVPPASRRRRVQSLTE